MVGPQKQETAAKIETPEMEQVRAQLPGTVPSATQKMVINNKGKISDVYDLDKTKIGEGAYAYVCKATTKQTTKVRACKVNNKQKLKDIAKFRSEIELMGSLDHANILNLFEVFEDHRNIYLIMELCVGGELFDRVIDSGRFSEVDAAIIMQQILRAVFYMHENGIAHRDLKPENFIFVDDRPIDQTQLKVIDFGLASRFNSGTTMHTRAGTPYYVSPQVLVGDYDQSCDLWSCGVIMYILLCGYPPFDGDADADVLKKVKEGVFRFPSQEWKCVSSDAKNLIKNLLKFHQEERWTAQQALNDTWVANKAPKASAFEQPDSFVNKLRSFQAKNNLVKAAMRTIAWGLDDNEMKALRETFVALDTDSNGILTIAEVRDGLAKAGLKEIPADLQQMMEGIDADCSGAIDYTEFCAALLDRKTYMQEDICWAAFRVFDKNGDGKISQAEIQEVLANGTVQEAMGADAIKSLMVDVDTNGDGEIDFEEFMEMMRSSDR